MNNAVSAYLVPTRAVVFPEEYAECSVVLSNQGADDVPLPKDVWIRTLVKVASPNREVYEIYPFVGSAELDDNALLYAGGEPEKRFTLDRRIPNFGPGRWSLSATCDLNGTVLKTGLIQIEVAGPGAVEIAVPWPIGDTPGPVGEIWTLRKSGEHAMLARRTLSSPDPDVLTGWELFGVNRAGSMDKDVRGLMASSDESAGRPRDRRWVGWISGDNTCCFGVTARDFETCRINLGDAGRFVPKLLVRRDGGVDGFIFSNDASTLSLIRAVAPVWSSVEDDEAEVEDDAPDVSPVTLPEPSVIARQPLPFRPTHSVCAKSWSGEEERLCVGLAVNLGKDIDFLLLIMNAQGEMVHSGGYRIANAALIPEADPVMAVDASGRALVTVLHTSDDGAGLSRTRLAFGPDAIPIMIEPSGHQQLCKLAAPVESGTIVAAGDPLQWATGWCVITTDGQMLRGLSKRLQEVTEVPAGLMRPIAVVAGRTGVGVAVQTAAGAIIFV